MSAYFPQESFRAIIAGLVGGIVQVVWDGQPVNFAAPSGLDTTGVASLGVTSAPAPSTPSGQGARVTLSILSDGAIGVDEVLRSGPNTNNEIDVQVGGQRKASIQIRVEADPFGASLNVAQRIRTCLRYPATLDALEAQGLGLSSIGDVTTLKASWQGKAINVSVFDVRIGYSVTTDVDSSQQVYWIESVDEIDGTVTE